MAQIGKDYYEDLTTDRLAEIIDELAAGRVPAPGPQNGRFASETSRVAALCLFGRKKTRELATAVSYPRPAAPPLPACWSKKKKRCFRPRPLRT